MHTSQPLIGSAPDGQPTIGHTPDGDLRRRVRSVALSTLSSLRPIVDAVYGGLGTILAFHRLVEERTGPRLAWMQSLEATVDEVEGILRHVTRTGRAVLSLDEIAEGLRRGNLRHPFVAFTFDDGYRDNLTLGLPLFEKYRAPFAVYVTTDFPDRKATMWWYAAEEALLRAGSQLDLGHNGSHRTCRTGTPFEKEAAFLAIQEMTRGMSTGALESFADEAFGAERMRGLRELAMSWDDVRALARSPLATIGAHTVTHRPLSGLDPAEVKEEVMGSRRRLEEQLGRPIVHFAYPFGQRPGLTEREVAIVADCGFASATTTVTGNVFGEHATATAALPRATYWGESAADLDAKVFSGATAVIRHRGRRIAPV